MEHFKYFSSEGGINSKIPKCNQAYFRKLESIKHFVSGLTQPLIRHYHMAELLVPGLSPFFPHGFPEQEPTGQWEVSLNRLVQLLKDHRFTNDMPHTLPLELGF